MQEELAQRVRTPVGDRRAQVVEVVEVVEIQKLHRREIMVALVVAVPLGQVEVVVEAVLMLGVLVALREAAMLASL